MDVKRLVVDALALLAYAIASFPAATGIGAHEWLGAAVALVFLVHVAQHADWLPQTLRPAAKPLSKAGAGSLIVDTLLFVALAVCTVSGLMISGALLPTFGLYAEGYYFWNPLHAASAKVLFALIIVHLALHWRWLFALIKRKGASRVDAD